VSLPDPEELLAGLLEAMRPAVTPACALVGIHSGGVWVAQRLHAALGTTTPLGTLDANFYRDDFGRRGLKPGVRPTELPFEVAGADVVLVDDVLFTGRTIRAALNVLFDYGRPARVRLAALVDRGGRELPVAADWTGGRMQVPVDRMVVVERGADGRLVLSLTERDGAA
jgi:pyrimidine operon attenuation protein/uracil phosphoribosyltransferase